MAKVLEAAVDWNGGDYKEPPVIGLRAQARGLRGLGNVARVVYRASLWKKLGFDTARGLHGRDTGSSSFAAWRQIIFLSQIETWKSHNVGTTPGFGGDYRKALASVQARTLVYPLRDRPLFSCRRRRRRGRLHPECDRQDDTFCLGSLGGLRKTTKPTARLSTQRLRNFCPIIRRAAKPRGERDRSATYSIRTT